MGKHLDEIRSDPDYRALVAAEAQRDEARAEVKRLRGERRAAEDAWREEFSAALLSENADLRARLERAEAEVERLRQAEADHEYLRDRGDVTIYRDEYERLRLAGAALKDVEFGTEGLCAWCWDHGHRSGGDHMDGCIVAAALASTGEDK